MLQALITLMVLASGAHGKDAIRPGNPHYQLELAFEQAQADGAFYEDAIALQMAQANERVAEAQAAHAEGNPAGMDVALGAYGLVVADLAESVTSAENIDDDALIELLDADLSAQDQQIAQLQQNCADGDQNGIDDITGLPCASAGGGGEQAALCADGDQNGIDDITGQPCGSSEEDDQGEQAGPCADGDQNGIDDISGQPCSPAGGGETQGEQGAEGDAGGAAFCARPDHPSAAKIAEKLGLTYDQVMALACKDGVKQLGFGKIMMLAKLSQASGKSIEELIAMHDGGMSWGQIKKELGVTKPGGKPGKSGEHGNANGNGNGGDENGGGNGNGKKCTDKNPKDDIDDLSGQPCPPKGNGNGGDEHGGGNGNGKKCTDKNPKDDIDDLSGQPCPPKGNADANGNGGGNGNGKKCADKNPKDGIDDVTGQPCPPKSDDDDADEDEAEVEEIEEPAESPTAEPTAEPTTQP